MKTYPFTLWALSAMIGCDAYNLHWYQYIRCFKDMYKYYDSSRVTIDHNKILWEIPKYINSYNIT